jgi:hypothetical protein
LPYAASTDGTLQTSTGSAADGQTAPCWIVLTSDGRYADGILALLNSVAANTGPESSPLDEAISNDSRYVYVLTPGAGIVTLAAQNRADEMRTGTCFHPDQGFLQVRRIGQQLLAGELLLNDHSAMVIQAHKMKRRFTQVDPNRSDMHPMILLV